MSQKFALSIIFPIYNEEINIQRTIEDSLNYLRGFEGVQEYEVILVNDGSTDGTSKILEEVVKDKNELVLINHTQNEGYGAALITGIKKAKYEWVLLMDSDGQIKINSVNAMKEFTDDYDIIAGYRAKRCDSIYRIILGKIYTTLASSFLKVRSRDINCGFKMFRKEFLDIEGINSHAGAFYTHVYIKAQAKDARIKEVPIEHFPREGGVPTGANMKVILTAMQDFFNLLFKKK